MKPVQRLNRESVSTLERYDSDADTAIRKMEKTIEMLQIRNKTVENVTESLQKAAVDVTKPLQAANFAPDYWKKVELSVNEAIEKAKRY